MIVVRVWKKANSSILIISHDKKKNVMSWFKVNLRYLKVYENRKLYYSVGALGILGSHSVGIEILVPLESTKYLRHPIEYYYNNFSFSNGVIVFASSTSFWLRMRYVPSIRITEISCIITVIQFHEVKHIKRRKIAYQ